MRRLGSLRLHENKCVVECARRAPPSIPRPAPTPPQTTPHTRPRAPPERFRARIRRPDGRAQTAAFARYLMPGFRLMSPRDLAEDACSSPRADRRFPESAIGAFVARTLLRAGFPRSVRTSGQRKVPAPPPPPPPPLGISLRPSSLLAGRIEWGADPSGPRVFF